MSEAPAPPAEATELSALNRTQLRRNLSQYFSVEEIAILCSDLGLDSEVIPGRDQGKDYWVSKIIRYCELAGLIPTFIQHLQSNRPHIAWAPLLDGLQKLPAPPQGALQALIDEIEKQRRTIRIFNVTVPAVPVLIGFTVFVALVVFGVWFVSTPSQMPEGVTKINVAVADFGQRQADGSVRSSTEGAFLSRELFDGLNQELAPLADKFGKDFQLTVWHDSMGLRKRATIGTIGDDKAAAKLAQDIRASVVIYGVIEVTQGITRVIPQFYVPATRGEADEIIGPYTFGKPIEANTRAQDDFWLQSSLKARQKALSGFIVGLSYDLVGATQQAQTAFEAIDGDSTIAWPAGAGKEVLYYFIGRQLLQRQAVLKDIDQRKDLINQAEAWYQKAISASANYARAYVGMGSVHYLRARLIKPAERLGSADFVDEVTLSLEAYERGLGEAQAQNLTEVAGMALSGLGYIQRLEAEAHLVAAASSCSGTPTDVIELTLAVEALNQAAGDLDQAITHLTANQQRRESARAYVAQGAAFEQLGCASRLQGNPQQAKAFFEKAIQSYAGCIAQQGLSPNDRLIREDIVQKECLPYQQRAQKRRDEVP